MLDDLVGEAVDDVHTVGLVLHGSRGVGVARVDSDYDVIWVVGDEVYAQRREEGRLFERRAKARVDLLYQSPGRLAWIAEHPDWYTSTYLHVRVLVDRSGAVAYRFAGSAAHGRAAATLLDYYDNYLTGFSQSLKCWRRGETLGGRLNAAESARYLVRVLFAAAGEWAPYPDHVSRALPRLEATLEWPAGTLDESLAESLTESLTRLVEHGDPAHQQRLERRVSTLISARGLHYQPDPSVIVARTWDFGTR